MRSWTMPAIGADLGQARLPLQDALGQVGDRAHPLPLDPRQRPGAVPCPRRHPDRPEPADEPGAFDELHDAGGQSHDAGRRPGERGHGPRVTEEPRRLDVRVVGEGLERRPQLGVVHLVVERRAAVDHDAPGIDRVQVPEDRRRVGDADVHERRVVFPAASFARACRPPTGCRPAARRPRSRWRCGPRA